MRVNYWSHSKFANWIRKVNNAPEPLKCGTMEEWRDYHKACKEHSRLVVWITDDMMDALQNFCYWPSDKLHSFVYWINKRFIFPSHIIKTGLKKGEWHETDEKILHGVFEELVNFVEHQKGSHSWSSDDRKFVPWYEKHWFTRNLTDWGSQHYGINHLLWETALTYDESMGVYPGEADGLYGKPTRQAESAMEQLDLYCWWKFIRPMRGDPHDLGGWSNYCDMMRDRYGDEYFFGSDGTEEEKTICKVSLDATHAIEQQYEQEDTNNLKRLVDIRRSLWT